MVPKIGGAPGHDSLAPLLLELIYTTFCLWFPNGVTLRLSGSIGRLVSNRSVRPHGNTYVIGAVADIDRITFQFFELLLQLLHIRTRCLDPYVVTPKQMTHPIGVIGTKSEHYARNDSRNPKQESRQNGFSAGLARSDQAHQHVNQQETGTNATNMPKIGNQMENS